MPSRRRGVSCRRAGGALIADAADDAAQDVARAQGLAGLVLGQSGLQAVRPTDVDSLHLVLLFTAVWVGFQVGLGLDSPAIRRPGRLAALVVLSTMAVFLVTSVRVSALGKQPWHLALAIGAITCLWGPCIVSFLTEDNEIRFISVIGAGIALVLLTGTELMLHRGGPSFEVAVRTAASPWISLAAGLAVAEILWRLGIFSRRSTAVAGSVGSFLLMAAILGELGLYGLPFGFACGALLSWHEGSGDTLRHLLEPARSMAAMVFFALLGASLDVSAALAPPHHSLYLIVLIQVVVLILMRGVGPAVLAARQAGLLVDGGGHARAAGFTVEASGVDKLRAFLSEHIARQLDRRSPTPPYEIDGALAPPGATRTANSIRSEAS